MVIAVVGNFDPATIEAEVEAAVRDLPARPLPARTPVSPQRAEEQVLERVSAGTHQAQVLVGVPGPSLTSRDRYAFAVLDAIVDDAGRRLFTEIRDRRGLAYSVGSSLISLTDTGVWLMAAGVDPENVDLVTELLLAEMRRLREEPVSQEELESAKSYLEGRSVLGLETNLGQARRFASQEALGVREPIADYLAQIRLVTAEDIHRVANQYIDLERYTRVLVEP
jgi:zinc protease